MLGAAGEHAVRLDGRLGDEVVHHDAEVGLVAGDGDEWERERESRGVEAGDEALAGGFFVAAGAVDLAGEEEAVHQFGHGRRPDLVGADHVVLDGVAVLENLGLLAALHGADDVVLDVFGEAG